MRIIKLILAGLIAWCLAGGEGRGASSALIAGAASTNSSARAAATTNQTMPQAMQLFQAGRFDAARKVCDDLILRGEKDRDAQEALYLKGKCCQALSQYPAAIESWKILLERYSKTDWDEEVLVEMARIYSGNLNQPDKTILYCERLIRKYPRSKRLNEAQYQLGVGAYMTGDYRKAKTAFESVLAKDPEGTCAKDAQEWLNNTMAALNSLTPARAQTPVPKTVQPEKAPDQQSGLLAAIAEGESLQNKGETQAALIVFQRIVKNNVWCPGYDQALFRLGQCQAVLGQEERAVETWEEVIKLTRRNLPCEFAADCLMGQADIWLNALCKPEKALNCCQALVKEYPQSALIPQAEHLMGLAYLHQGELVKARVIFEAELEKVREQAKTNAPASTDTALSCEGKSTALRGEAVPQSGLERLLALCQGHQSAGIFPGGGLKTTTRAAPLIRLGDLQFTAKEYAQALRLYEKAVREAPGTDKAAYALLQTGRCLNQLRRYREALRCYDQFLTTYRESQYANEALLRSGVIYVGPLHDMDSGAKMYTTLLERYPHSSTAETAQYHLATLAYWKKDWERALEMYQRVAEAYPNGRYAQVVAMRKVPELTSRLKTNKKVSGDKS